MTVMTLTDHSLRPDETATFARPIDSAASRAALALAGSGAAEIDGLPSRWFSESMAARANPIDVWSPIDGGAIEQRTRVLLVDDESDEFMLCRDLLLRAGDPGFSLQWARSFETGLEMLGQDQPNVCLVDYQLGIRTGIDFIREAVVSATTDQIPLILMTGRGGRDIDADAVEAGAADYLDKLDLTPEMLERSIRHAIERSATIGQLRASDDFYRSIIGSMADAVLILAADGRILAANPAACRILQVVPAALVGRAAMDDDWSWFDAAGGPLVGSDHPLRVAAGRSVPSMTVALSGRNGADRLLLLSIEAMPAARREAAFVVSFEDVTDVRRAARLLANTERVDALDRLAGHVAHDFNNLITVMRGCVDLLQVEGSDEAQRAELFVTLRATTDRARELTRSLVDLRGESRLSERDLDLGPFVEALRGTVQQLVGGAIAVGVATPDVPLVVRIDPERLELAILNLASNARDAMPDGGRLDIAVEVVEAGADDGPAAGARSGPTARITVRDTGHGMDEATRAHAFDPYFSTKERGRGTGLGLASVHGTVMDAGGKIAIESAPDAGTTVRIWLDRHPDRRRPVTKA